VGAGGRLAFYYLAAAPVVVATVLASPLMALAMATAQSAVVAPVFLLGAEPAMEQAHSTEWAPGLVGLFVAVGLFAIVRGLFDRLEQTGVAFRERATATAAAERAAAAARQRARVTRGLNRQLGDLLRELCTDAVALRRRRTDDPEWGVQAAAVERIARDAVAELRRATEAGAPPATVGAALAAACERVRRLGADAIELDVGGCGALALTPAEAAALSRFVQEAVTNAWKHGAPPVIVRAAAAGNRVAVTVADAGAGFEPADPAGGRGLSSLAHDAGTLGGRLGFSRPVTGGTAVRLEFEAPDG
jgi:signal transduction histidine kinase